MRRRWQWLRFVRVVVACLAFLVVRPPPCAADTFAIAGEVVLAASAGASEESKDVDPGPIHGGRRTSRRVSTRVDRSSPPSPLFTRETPRVLVDRAYLRNCALLR